MVSARCSCRGASRSQKDQASWTHFPSLGLKWTKPYGITCHWKSSPPIFVLLPVRLPMSSKPYSNGIRENSGSSGIVRRWRMRPSAVVNSPNEDSLFSADRVGSAGAGEGFRRDRDSGPIKGRNLRGIQNLWKFACSFPLVKNDFGRFRIIHGSQRSESLLTGLRAIRSEDGGQGFILHGSRAMIEPQCSAVDQSGRKT